MRPPAGTLSAYFDIDHLACCFRGLGEWGEAFVTYQDIENNAERKCVVSGEKRGEFLFVKVAIVQLDGAVLV